MTLLSAQEFETLLENLQQRHVMVLVTSRKAVGVGLGLVEPVKLDALPADTSMQLLMRLAGRTDTWNELEAAELVGICGYNALAITILAGLMKNLHVTPLVRAHLHMDNDEHAGFLATCCRRQHNSFRRFLKDFIISCK